jgi:hypothetical protein
MGKAATTSSGSLKETGAGAQAKTGTPDQLDGPAHRECHYGCSATVAETREG